MINHVVFHTIVKSLITIKIQSLENVKKTIQ